MFIMYTCTKLYRDLQLIPVNNSFEKIAIYPIQNIVKDSSDSILKVH